MSFPTTQIHYFDITIAPGVIDLVGFAVLLAFVLLRILVWKSTFSNLQYLLIVWSRFCMSLSSYYTAKSLEQSNLRFTVIGL